MSNILVIDDAAAFREPIAVALRHRGHDVTCADDGAEAITSMLGKTPDLVLLDMAMPNLNGLDVLRAMRASPVLVRVPVIMLTALAQRDTIVEAGRMGVRDYMLKSHFSLGELYERIERRLGLNHDTPPVAHPPVAAAPAADAPARTGTPPAAVPQGAAPPPPASTQAPIGSSPPPPPPPFAPVAEPLNPRDLRPVITRSDLQDRLEACIELRAMSPIVMRALQLTGSASCSLEDVSSVIRQDHAIALKILKLANSVVYTRGDPVESVHKAVMRIGLTQIRQALTNIGVIDRFSQVDHDPRICAPLFWEHAIATGLIAAEIARARELKDAEVDAAFTMGLLHDVGRLVYAEILEGQYSRVLDAAERCQIPLEQAESRMLLLNHADAMDRLLHGWRFPKELINPIALHHLSLGNVRRLAVHSVTEVSTLALANRLAHAMLLGSSGNLCLYPTEEFADVLRLPEGLLDDILSRVPDATDDMKLALLSRSSHDNWPQMNREILAQLGGDFRPLHISDHPDTDAYRLFCSRLSTRAEGQPHNIAIVHLREVRDRALVTRELAAALAAQRLDRLPTLILSPNGNLGLDPPLLGRIPCTLLPDVITVHRFVAIAAHAIAAHKPAAVVGKNAVVR